MAYFAAETLSSQWTFEAFRRQSLRMLVGGTVGVGFLAFPRHPWLESLAHQHELPTFAQGRFVRQWRADSRMFGLVSITSAGLGTVSLTRFGGRRFIPAGPENLSN